MALSTKLLLIPLKARAPAAPRFFWLVAKMFASTSKTMFVRAATRSNIARTYATQSSSTATVTESTLTSSPAPSPSLPGSPLPAAYRAASSPQQSMTNGEPSSPSSTPARVTPRRPGSFASSRLAANFYKLHVFSTRNNTILTLTTTPGSSSSASSQDRSSSSSSSSPSDPHHAVAWVSAGSAGYKGASRGTYDAAVEVSLKMFKKIQELKTPTVGPGGLKKKVIWPPPTDLEVVWKGFGQGRDAVFRTLMSGEGDGVRGLVKQVTDAVSVLGGFKSDRRSLELTRRECCRLRSRLAVHGQRSDECMSYER